MIKTHTKKSIIQTLKAHREQLQAYGVEEIGLFGSYVRNEATINSDIDLLVNLRKEKKHSEILCHWHTTLKMYLIVKLNL